jgi:glycolate oxidase iron-sulfur subunit
MDPEHAKPQGRSLIDDCVHCGFCLPACPTYNSWSEEMDSPRGRIDLMKGLRDGKITLSDTVVEHFDRCLGCMGCVTACPSGVKYDILIEQTRAKIEQTHRRPWGQRIYRSALFAMLPYPGRWKIAVFFLLAYVKSGLRSLLRAAGLFKLLPPRFAELEALIPPVSLKQLTATLPRRTEARGPRRARVGLVAGCVQRALFPAVNEATIRVLAAEGCDVAVPAGQGCCGALSIHAGREAEALAFARALIERFEAFPDLDAIIVNAAGCGSNLKDYGRLFAGDPAWSKRAAAFAAKVRDVSEFLAVLPPVAQRHPMARRVAYHDACHLAHAQRVREQPRALLRSIPGLELVDIPDGDQCCGSAGVYNLIQQESAQQIGERKGDNVLAARPQLLASANPGCTLQIQKVLRARGVELEAAHPIELLDASIAGGDGRGIESRKTGTAYGLDSGEAGRRR